MYFGQQKKSVIQAKLSELISLMKCWSEPEEIEMRAATPMWNLEKEI